MEMAQNAAASPKTTAASLQITRMITTITSQNTNLFKDTTNTITDTNSITMDTNRITMDTSKLYNNRLPSPSRDTSSNRIRDTTIIITGRLSKAIFIRLSMNRIIHTRITIRGTTLRIYQP
mmetsp:Transcript_112325/g.204203  ORF Transcript_112325/g.204203 Transcript_112325/m.204203 type:complete len:121 (+) Transcript_112325:90-452(+)